MLGARWQLGKFLRDSGDTVVGTRAGLAALPLSRALGVLKREAERMMSANFVGVS